MDVISLSAIKKAKEEIIGRLEQTTMSIVLELRDKLSKLDTEKLNAGDFNQMMVSIQEHFLSKLDANISSRLSKVDFDRWKAPWTAERAGKIDNLDASVSSRLSKVDFSKDINTLKKSLGQRIIELSSRLALMDAKPNAETLPAVKAALDSVPVIGLVTKVLTTQGERYTIPRGYHNGSGYVDTNITNLRSENIKKGVNVGGIIGTLSPKINYTQKVTGYSNKEATCTIPFDVLYYFWVIQKSGYSADSVHTYIVFPDGSYHVVNGEADKWTDEWILKSISEDKHSFTNRSFDGIGVYVTWSN